MEKLVISYRKCRRRCKRKREQPDDNIKKSKRVCQFCLSGEDNEVNFGAIIEKEDVTVHYFCMLLASGLCQNTKISDKKGILGFLLSDIKKELTRGGRLRCCFCRGKGATIGCCIQTCRRAFHLRCGRRNGTMHQFFGSFRSFCGEHRPAQLPTKEIALVQSPGKRSCSICMCSVTSFISCDSLFSVCCRKSWFHRTCIQGYALSAGKHYFKCPLCNAVKDFQDDMLKHGIYIPDQDASWEREPNAFQELLERHNTCDVSDCVCPEGRKYDADSGKYELLLCNWCGSYGAHRACKGLVWKQKSLVCYDCAEIIDAAKKKHQDDASKGTCLAQECQSQPQVISAREQSQTYQQSQELQVDQHIHSTSTEQHLHHRANSQRENSLAPRGEVSGSQITGNQQSITVPKKRGRPRKHSIVLQQSALVNGQTVVKRRRGRPKKIESSQRPSVNGQLFAVSRNERQRALRSASMAGKPMHIKSEPETVSYRMRDHLRKYPAKAKTPTAAQALDPTNCRTDIITADNLERVVKELKFGSYFTVPRVVLRRIDNKISMSFGKINVNKLPQNPRQEEKSIIGRGIGGIHEPLMGTELNNQRNTQDIKMSMSDTQCKHKSEDVETLATTQERSARSMDFSGSTAHVPESLTELPATSNKTSPAVLPVIESENCKTPFNCELDRHTRLLKQTSTSDLEAGMEMEGISEKTEKDESLNEKQQERFSNARNSSILCPITAADHSAQNMASNGAASGAECNNLIQVDNWYSHVADQENASPDLKGYGQENECLDKVTESNGVEEFSEQSDSNTQIYIQLHGSSRYSESESHELPQNLNLVAIESPEETALSIIEDILEGIVKTKCEDENAECEFMGSTMQMETLDKFLGSSDGQVDGTSGDSFPESVKVQTCKLPGIKTENETTTG